MATKDNGEQFTIDEAAAAKIAATEEAERKARIAEAERREAQREQDQKDGVIRVPLRKKLQSFDKELTELVLREPTAHDIERFGNPVYLDFSKDPPKITFEPIPMSNMIGELAGMTLATTRRMDTRDWNTVAYALAGFFLPDMGNG